MVACWKHDQKKIKLLPLNNVVFLALRISTAVEMKHFSSSLELCRYKKRRLSPWRRLYYTVHKKDDGKVNAFEFPSPPPPNDAMWFRIF